MDFYLEVLKKWSDFDSRASRNEYWMFWLYNMIIGFILGMLMGIGGDSALGALLTIIYSIWGLVLFFPNLAVAIRRLHDTNMSGWNLLWSLIPFFGALYVFILLVSKGNYEENDYGPPPSE